MNVWERHEREYVSHGQPPLTEELKMGVLQNYLAPDEVTTLSGTCLHQVDNTGATCGTECLSETNCRADEICGNHTDDDCDGTVDDGCPDPCASDAACGLNEVCLDGYCQVCAALPVECTAVNAADPLCAYDTENASGPITVNGICLQRANAAGLACGAVCTGSDLFEATERCGNRLDDDGNGIVDDGCTSCDADAVCGAGAWCLY